VHTLALLLHAKDPSEKPNKLVSCGREELLSYTLITTQKDLCKAYLGESGYSGASMKIIKNVTYSLANKSFLIKYNRHIEKEDKRTIKYCQPLITLNKFSPNEIDISLNPIFTDQIDSKFVEFPIDLNRRLITSAGHHNRVTESLNILLEWVFREISSKRYRVEINEENLPTILGLEKDLKARKTRTNNRILEDINILIKLGLLLNWEKHPNATGGIKWVFHVNKELK